MSQTKWVQLPRSKREPLKGARVVAAVPDHEEIEVTVKVRHAPGSKSLSASVAALAASPPMERRHLTRHEYAEAHGATLDDLHKVMAFASAHGLTAHDPNLARRSLHLSGTAAAMTAAFQVDLKHYEVDGGPSYRGNADHVHIPEELSGLVEAVIGFDTRPYVRPHFRMAHATAATPQAFNPPDVARLYNFPSDVDGTGQVIGIIELAAPKGSGYRPSELQEYFMTRLGLAKMPEVVSFSVLKARNTPGTNPSDPQNNDGEVLLDIEVAGSVAPGAKIVVYFAPNTPQGFMEVISTAIHDSVNKPTVISLSYGGPETAGDPTTDQIEQALQAASTMGVTVCVASGDSGSADDPYSTSAGVDYPASSQYVLGCGGTELTASGATIADEVAWGELASGNGATGGGVSRLFGLPTYQASAGVPAAVNPPGSVGRGVPDVAGNADPITGYNVLVDGQFGAIGGTSAVAPLWAGLIALINQKLGQPVGFVNPTLYANPAAFRDILSGSNGDYQAGPGWDPCTGLGSPDGMKLLAAFSGTTATGGNGNGNGGS